MESYNSIQRKKLLYNFFSQFIQRQKSAENSIEFSKIEIFLLNFIIHDNIEYKRHKVKLKKMC